MLSATYITEESAWENYFKIPVSVLIGVMHSLTLLFHYIPLPFPAASAVVLKSSPYTCLSRPWLETFAAEQLPFGSCLLHSSPMWLLIGLLHPASDRSMHICMHTSLVKQEENYNSSDSQNLPVLQKN